MKIFKSILFAGLAVISVLSFAGEVKPYAQAEFDKLNAEGKGVVLAIHAPWCPTCKVQSPIQSELMSSPAFKDVTMMTIDFDSQKDVLKNFKVSMQSTIISFKGGKEVGRSVGDSTRAGIEALYKKTLN
jgi:thiol-disulfide isomerase/thioredoxin